MMRTCAETPAGCPCPPLADLAQIKRLSPRKRARPVMSPTGPSPPRRGRRGGGLRLGAVGLWGGEGGVGGPAPRPGAGSVQSHRLRGVAGDRNGRRAEAPSPEPPGLPAPASLSAGLRLNPAHGGRRERGPRHPSVRRRAGADRPGGALHCAGALLRLISVSSLRNIIQSAAREPWVGPCLSANKGTSLRLDGLARRRAAAFPDASKETPRAGPSGQSCRTPVGRCREGSGGGRGLPRRAASTGSGLRASRTAAASPGRGLGRLGSTSQPTGWAGPSSRGVASAGFSAHESADFVGRASPLGVACRFPGRLAESGAPGRPRGAGEGRCAASPLPVTPGDAAGAAASPRCPQPLSPAGRP